MAMKGLFNKIKNPLTRRRYVVSTIRKGENLFETAVFEANFFYLPRRWARPDITVETHTKEEAWELHHRLTGRLTKEYPAQVFRDYA
jgi:DNA-binding MarR family transcriptional regulator